MATARWQEGGAPALMVRRRLKSKMAFAAILLLVACRKSDGGASGNQGTTFTLWHYESPKSAMGQAWKESIEEFKRTHPGVTVVFEEKGFEQIQKTGPMVLNSNSAPDLLEYPKGNATAGQLSKQGLLTDLSPEAEKRGWDKALGPGVRIPCQYDAAGQMGSGKWYGVPNYVEYTMAFYNKDLFDKYGVKVPTTEGELVTALSAFKSHGITPLASGGAEYVAHQYLYQLALSKADRAWVDAYQRYTAKVDFHDAAWTYAATTFVDWVNKGYISKQSSSMKTEDTGLAFMSGKHPIFFSGSWWFGRLMAEVKFNWGTFLWPGSRMTLGSSGNLWIVPQGAKNKQLAYDFIDITMSKRIQNLLGNNGGVPVAAESSAITDAKSKELLEHFEILSKNDGLAFYPDWPVPGFYDVLVSETQKLITAAATPHEYLDALQKAYDAGAPKK